jgi:hypothetical protein
VALVIGRGPAAQRFPIDAAESFGGPGAPERGLNADVAVIHLARPVPPDLARPRPLARAPIGPGEPVTFVATADGDAPRLAAWPFDPSRSGRAMRPGDSGGPLLRGLPAEPGPIVAVGSGYASTRCADEVPDAMTFGDVAAAAPAIERAVAGWAAPGR